MKRDCPQPPQSSHPLPVEMCSAKVVIVALSQYSIACGKLKLLMNDGDLRCCLRSEMIARNRVHASIPRRSNGTRFHGTS